MKRVRRVSKRIRKTGSGLKVEATLGETRSAGRRKTKHTFMLGSANVHEGLGKGFERIDCYEFNDDLRRMREAIIEQEKLLNVMLVGEEES